MLYPDLAFYTRFPSPFWKINSFNLQMNQHEKITLKRLIQIKMVLNLINGRSDLISKHNIGKIFDFLIGVFQVIDEHYDNQMFNASSDSLLDQYLLSQEKELYSKTRSITKENPKGVSRSKQYLADMKKASKINKFIQETLNKMKTNKITINVEHFIDYCLSKYPETTYNIEQLDLLIELFIFSKTIQNFTLKSIKNYHKSYIHMTCSYIDLAKYLSTNLSITTIQRFYLSSFLKISNIQGMTYKKANTFLKYSYNQKLLSLWDKKYIKNQIGTSTKLRDFLDTIDLMIELTKK